MAQDNKYNGWTNYETWRVNLEICDDYMQSLAQDGMTFTDVNTLAEYLKDYVDEVLTNFGQVEDGIALDYARSFVSDVDWYEIAEHGVEAGLIESEEDEEG